VLTPENTSNTTSDNTVTAGVANGGPDDASGSILVTIAGPVSSFDIIYENDSTGGQRMWVSDIHFDTVPNPDGDDILSGGTGADDIFGGGGNDTISVADGDDAFGEDGDDTFILTDLGETNSAITIDGGEGGETGGDTIQLGGLAGLDDVTYDVGNPESGTITLTDGTVVTFSNIENIICFTPGAMISTPFGPRPVETLQAGDLVLTRDAGPQPIRWIGQRTVAATGDFAPVSIAGAALPHATAPLLVSPQHRMLFTGYRAELLFGEREVFVAAKHLVDGRDVTFQPQAQVTYIHLMFDTHQIIEANGEPTESLHIGDETLAALSPGSREEVFSLFPQLRSHHGFPTARRALRRYEAALL
ncbi:MAG: Hint domain-containing protein, partial [Pseudomonadota bacterium]